MVNFGWKGRSPLDTRDYLAKKFLVTTPKELPTSVDLRKGCSPIVDQGDLGSCTANAGAGLVDYSENVEGDGFLLGSRLYLYYKTRVDVEGGDPNEDSGAYIRDTLKALAKFGICKETTLPYDISKFAKKPSSKAVKEAMKYQAKVYALVDEPGMTGEQILNAVKTQLNVGHPMEFGFYIFDSYGQSQSNGGCFPFPTNMESVQGGHAIVAVGYNDCKIITNKLDGSTTTGALLIRNSWGDWGEAGYGWLPYKYITTKSDGEYLANDFWILTKVGA